MEITGVNGQNWEMLVGTSHHGLPSGISPCDKLDYVDLDMNTGWGCELLPAGITLSWQPQLGFPPAP